MELSEIPPETCLDLRKEELLMALLKLGIYVFPQIDLVRLFVDSNRELVVLDPCSYSALPTSHPNQRMSSVSSCEPRQLCRQNHGCVLASAICSFVH